MKIQKPGAVGASLVTTIATLFALASPARADHDFRILRAKADAVYHSVVDLESTMIDSYSRSRVFGQMMATSARIKAGALYLRGMAWSGSSCQWSAEIERLDNRVHKLEALFEAAHRRAAQGLDPPISYCSIEAGRRLEAVVDLIHCMRDALVVGPVVSPPVIRPPRCYGTPGGGRYDPYRQSGIYGNSYGNSYGRSYGNSYGRSQINRQTSGINVRRGGQNWQSWVSLADQLLGNR